MALSCSPKVEAIETAVPMADASNVNANLAKALRGEHHIKVEADYLEFNSGAELTITTAPQQAHLIVPPVGAGA